MVDEIRRVVRRAPDLEAKRRELEAFLATHGNSSAAEDRAIVEYLLSGIERGPAAAAGR